MSDTKPYTRMQTFPVCPHCGHSHRDAWEWNFGPGLEGEKSRECDECGKPFKCRREVEISYTTEIVES